MYWPPVEEEYLTYSNLVKECYLASMIKNMVSLCVGCCHIRAGQGRTTDLLVLGYMWMLRPNIRLRSYFTGWGKAG